MLGSCLAFVLNPSTLFAFKEYTDKDITSQLKARSIDAFKRFSEIWEFNDFWKRGNTFDACLTFVDAMQQQWPDDPAVKEMQIKVKEMLEKNLLFFNSFNPGDLFCSKLVNQSWLIHT